MTRTEIKQGYRLMRFEELYESWFEGNLTQCQAAEVLGVSERTFRRHVERYKDEGIEGVIDGRLARRGETRIPPEVVEFVTELYQEKYFDYNTRHFFQVLRRDHNFSHSYNWLRGVLQLRGITKPLPRRGVYRRKRARKAMVGMMLHQDGSTHAWLPGRMDDLIVTLDDATNEIYSIFLVEEEGTISSLKGIRDVVDKKGIFCSLYVDRGSHYVHTPSAGGKVSKHEHTQVQRACRQLGIEMIFAYSPQARGRSERMFRTLQGRLPQELRAHDITSIEQANAYIRERFLPAFNAEFMIPPAHPTSAFCPYIGHDLDVVLSLQEHRVVKNDNTLSFNNKVLQLPSDEFRHHYVRSKVTVCQHLEGHISVLYGPRIIAIFEKDGSLRDQPSLQEVA